LLANQQTGFMKTTFDLPEALVKRIKLHALRKGQKLKDVVADLLRKGLASSLEQGVPATARIGRDRLTGLPVILGGRKATPGTEMTPDRVADILLQQEVEWANVAGR
jgi:hypothetical protein